MNLVEPLKDKRDIKRMWDVLRDRSDRDALLFLTGIYTGFRISDILSLKVKHVYSGGVINDRIFLKEKKTGSNANRVIKSELARELLSYINLFQLEQNDYLFFKQLDTTTHISRQYTWYQLKKAAHRAGVDNFGTHSMRKTFGRFAYESTKNLALVMKLLNHKSPSVTLRYIGVSQDAEDSYMLEDWGLMGD